MVATTREKTPTIQLATVVLRTIVVLLTLATAQIHASLGGLMFMANAVGYSVLALAMVVPGPVARYRWLVRLALIGFAAVTIAGWVAFGARFDLAYLDKGIEVALIGILLVEQSRSDGGPAGVYRLVRRLVSGIATGTFARHAR
jgi:hypothetical protein